MTDDTLARARATLARLAEAERAATPGPWNNDDPWGNRQIEGPGMTIYDEGGHSEDDAAAIVALRNAAPALIALAEAVARLAASYQICPWWEAEAAGAYCIGCGQAASGDHAPDCPAVAVDTALAALAGDEPGAVGE